MSDSDGDFSDELLELAGAGEKRRKKTSSARVKRRKADAPSRSDSEHEYESEEDDSNPFPLDGKFVDEADRLKLMELPEIERENILAARQEEMQRVQDKRNLEKMLRAQHGDSENVSKSAKRAHQVRGATKEKTRKLDELKAKRRAKSEKKRTRVNSPKRERSSSPMDMEMSSEDEEDGQISKLEQQEERESRLLSMTKSDEEELTREDLEKCRLPRDNLVKYAKMPWFEEYAKGSWIRYLIGQDPSNPNQPVYRICEITNLGANLAKPYKIDNELFDTNLELKHGKSVRAFPMDRVSNAPFTEDEWRRFKIVLEHDKIKPPTKRSIERKVQQNFKLMEQPLTETDVAAIVARKLVMRNGPMSRTSATKAALDRIQLVRARDLARRRKDYAESTELDAQIAAIDAATPQVMESAVNEKEDILSRVNERNRQANRDAVRSAEIAAAERKRKAWMARAAANRSREGTPGSLNNATTVGTPKSGSLPVLDDAAGLRSVSPMPGQKAGLGKRTFESIVASSVDIDLGDF
ncbi:hypothetical protein EW145_g5445 [Phellinidium pouzarii]|uniref:Plus3 domain-containing protein n=1 Tax=Phellinidium pouzarii TaxID=167371 RepID=A0A4S4L4Q9_9AGAM|nr:hypothetical protein EW145_g5445 [Phellinidium pouzarii]